MVTGKSCCLLGVVVLLVLQPVNANIDIGDGAGVDDTPCNWPTGQQYWPHPTNCHMYVQCTPYGPQVMPCAPGTAWSQSLLTCDHEANTPCGEHPPPPPDNGGGGGGDGNCIKCNWPNGQQYWEHPTDCTKFIQCAPYGPQEMPCGAKTRWDQSILTCNHEDAITCKTGNYDNDDGSCGGGGDGGDGGGGGDDGGNPEPCGLICPLANGLFPHPRECNKWVECNDWDICVKRCPLGLFYNPIDKKCDWKTISNCIATPDAPCIIPIPEPPTPEPLPVKPEICDCECCLRPHPTDCTSYYYCAPGENAEFHTCSEGLVFNPDLGQCVPAMTYPECVPEVPPTCDPTCECVYPSETCEIYYKCDDGTPIKHECLGGLVYNDAIHSCDVPANVDCKAQTPSKRGFVMKGLKNAITAEDCATRDGKFPAGLSNQYFFCTKGMAFLMQCPGKAVFDEETGKCQV